MTADDIRACIALAAQSLSLIGGDYVLDISSLDILNAAVERVTDSRSLQNALVQCVSEKNLHGILALCEENGVDPALAGPLTVLTSLRVSTDAVLGELSGLCAAIGCEEAYDELKEAVSGLDEELLKHIKIDFSVVGDRGY